MYTNTHTEAHWVPLRPDSVLIGAIVYSHPQACCGVVRRRLCHLGMFHPPHQDMTHSTTCTPSSQELPAQNQSVYTIAELWFALTTLSGYIRNGNQYPVVTISWTKLEGLSSSIQNCECSLNLPCTETCMSWSRPLKTPNHSSPSTVNDRQIFIQQQKNTQQTDQKQHTLQGKQAVYRFVQEARPH